MNSVRVQVPGKIMLVGEYAVFEGGEALAFTIDKYLTLEASLRSKAELLVNSDLWPGPRVFDLSLPLGSAEPVIDAIGRGLAAFPSAAGLAINIKSELSPTFGVGSSAAVRLAALLAIKLLNAHSIEGQFTPEHFWDMARLAWISQKAKQGLASGYDVATQLVGGMIRILPDPDAWPGKIERLNLIENRLDDWIHLYVGGKGSDTGSDARSTMSWLRNCGKLPELLRRSQRLVEDFTELLCRDNVRGPLPIYHHIGKHREIFAAAPNYPTEILTPLIHLPGADHTWSFKTTGAGGEDAIILIGSKEEVNMAKLLLEKEGWYPLPARFSASGPQMSFMR